MSRLAQLQKLLESDPEDVFLLFGLAMEYRKAGRSEDAVAQFRRINQLDPSYIPAYFMQGQTLLSMDRRDDARAILTRGIEVAQQNNDPHAAAEMTETLQAIG